MPWDLCFMRPAPGGCRWKPPPGLPGNCRRLSRGSGVFVDASEAFIRQAIAECGLDALQFHGSEPPEFCRRFHRAAIKAIRVRDLDFPGGVAEL